MFLPTESFKFEKIIYWVNIFAKSKNRSTGVGKTTDIGHPHTENQDQKNSSETNLQLAKAILNQTVRHNLEI